MFIIYWSRTICTSHDTQFNCLLFLKKRRNTGTVRKTKITLIFQDFGTQDLLIQLQHFILWQVSSCSVNKVVI